MNAPQQALRRKMFIKRAFQGRFIAAVLLNLLLFALISAGLLYWLISSDLGAQANSAHASIERLWQRIGVLILGGNIVAGIVAGVTTARMVVHTSHKIAGPLFRFEEVCRQVGEGALDARTSLRDNDQLEDLADAFARMLERLRHARASRCASIAEVEARLKTLRTAALGQESLRALAEAEGLLKEMAERDGHSSIR